MYDYQTQRDELFNDRGHRLFLGIRDHVQKMLKVSGAFTMSNAMKLPSGIGAADGWTMMACVDRMVELGEIQEMPTTGRAQDRVFVAATSRD